MSYEAAAALAPGPAPAEVFRALADETRLRAVVLLHGEGELCVCELTEALAISQPKMSRHLATLRDNALVRGRREGFWIHYRLAPELPAWAVAAVDAACDGLCDQPPFRDDRSRLAAMAGRPGDRCPTPGGDAP
jgi:ArsR family transcriptional regulator